MARIINYTEATGLSEGDYIIIDNENGATKKLSLTNLIIKALNQEGKIPDAKTVGDAIAAVRAIAEANAEEIAGAKIGTDGTEYYSIGEHITMSVGALRTLINGVSEECPNVLDYALLPSGTVRGVTITKSEDVLTFTGTADSSSEDVSCTIPLTADTQYTAKIYSDSDKLINVEFRFTGDTPTRRPIGALNTPLTFVVPRNTTLVSMSISPVSGNVYSGDTYRISINKGDTNDYYIQYFSGITVVDRVARQNLSDHGSALSDINGELADGRSNTDGFVFNSIGDHIRNVMTSAKNEIAALESQLKEMEEALENVAIDPDDLGLYYDENTSYLYPTYRDTVSANGIFAQFGGGGGGGGGDTIDAELTVTNTTGWLSKTISDGEPCIVSFTWSSIENGMRTGDGNMRITVNDVIRASFQIKQEGVSVDLAPYLSSGTNKVKVRISDSYDQGKTTTFTITSVVLSLSSTFDTTQPYSSAFTFSCTPIGNVQKTIYVLVDNKVVASQTTSLSARQINLIIPSQSHGGHSLTVYFTADINGETVRSNTLYYEFIFLAPNNNTVVITSSFNTASVAQYSSVPIPYTVYNPTSLTSEVNIYINDALVSTQTVDRTEQSYTVKANNSGTETIRIESGGTSKTIQFTVTESAIDVEAETQDLALYLTAQGRSNNEEHPEVWRSGNISAQLSGFTWRLDGWQTDSDSINVLRLNDEARVTIPYLLFGEDFKGTGKTIEIEFATRDVVDYSATILSCLNGGTGLKITPQMVEFSGAQTSISTLYKDNEHLRLSIVVEKQSENRLILVYINGIMSRAIQYASGERFSQLNPVNITIGSDNCGIDIYNIRVYDNDLNRQQILDNWIADTQVGSLMLERYTRNNVYDASGAITPANLPSYLPYFIIEGSELPQFKGDKKTVSGSYNNVMYPSRSFTFDGCEIDAQGTSSSVYYVKNLDMKFKNGFVTPNGTVSSYALRTGSIPFNRFVLKADVASIESWNNTGLTMFYNDTCPYKTPEMVANDKVRWGIEGIPTVVFWHNTDTGETSFIGKYNFNLPKRAPAPYGYGDDDTLESWEWERNNSSNVKFQDNDFTSQSWDEQKQEYYPTWYDDFEARFPSDTYRDITQLNEFLSWVKSTRRETATGNTLSSPVTYTLGTTSTVTAYSSDTSFTVTERTEGNSKVYDIRFTKDTPAYRLTKFRAEFSNYAEIQSAVFYYLFTEQFLMIDSRAKNMFVGFNGSTVS